MSILLISPSFISSEAPKLPKMIDDYFKMVATDKWEEKLEELEINLRRPPPNGYQASRGLLSIAAYLEREGFKIKYLVVDYEMQENGNYDLKEILRKYLNGVEIVGITCHTFNYPEALRTLRFVKEINPTIKTVIGGVHATFMDKEIIKEKAVDIIVRGEGEQTFLEICKNKPLKNIKGITYKKGRNPDRPHLDLTKLPISAYHLLPDSDKISLGLETCRGCIFNCLFCSESKIWRGIRFRKIEDIIEELRLIQKKFKYNGIFFSDSTFVTNKKRVNELCSAIKKEKIDMHFSCSLRAELLTKEIIKKMKEIGFFEFYVGIESMSDTVLKVMNKNVTSKQYIKYCKQISLFDIILCTSWIVGHPGETKRTANESIKGMNYLLRKKYIDFVYPKLFIPYPGTPPFHFPKKYRMKILTKDWTKYDRFTTVPVYNLKNLNEFEISELYIKLIKNAFQYYDKARLEGVLHEQENKYDTTRISG